MIRTIVKTCLASEEVEKKPQFIIYCYYCHLIPSQRTRSTSVIVNELQIFRVHIEKQPAM